MNNEIKFLWKDKNSFVTEMATSKTVLLKVHILHVFNLESYLYPISYKYSWNLMLM